MELHRNLNQKLLNQLLLRSHKMINIRKGERYVYMLTIQYTEQIRRQRKENRESKCLLAKGQRKLYHNPELSTTYGKKTFTSFSLLPAKIYKSNSHLRSSCLNASLLSQETNGLDSIFIFLFYVGMVKRSIFANIF